MSYIFMNSCCLNINEWDNIFKMLSKFSHKVFMLDIFVTELPDDTKKVMERYFNKGIFSVISTEEENPETIDKFVSSNNLRNRISRNECLAIYMAKKLGCGIMAVEPAVIRLVKKLGVEILSILPSDVLIRGDSSFKTTLNTMLT